MVRPWNSGAHRSRLDTSQAEGREFEPRLLLHPPKFPIFTGIPTLDLYATAPYNWPKYRQVNRSSTAWVKSVPLLKLIALPSMGNR